MSCKVEGTSIYLTRGDSLTLEIGVQINKKTYVPVEGDTIKFALKRDKFKTDKSAYLDNEPLIEKEVSIDTMTLELDAADTASLAFGNYVYDLQITFSNGKVDTFINNAKFIILPEVA